MDGGRNARVVENATNHSAGVVSNQENASCSGESRACETCGQFRGSRLGIFGNWDGFPPGVKFDPTDEQLLHHLDAAIGNENPHPLIGSFIPVLAGEDGICQTHPMSLPGVKQDGSSRHFFHKPAKAYNTGNRKRRKIHTEVHKPEVEFRWHKTGKTRSVSERKDVILGWKKIMVLYKSSGAKKKPEKTNWILHQYHLGNTEEENDGELVVCKVFYQKQPRQCMSNPSEMSPKVHTPQRPSRCALPDQSSIWSEVTVVGTEAPAPVVWEQTSPPVPHSPETVVGTEAPAPVVPEQISPPVPHSPERVLDESHWKLETGDVDGGEALLGCDEGGLSNWRFPFDAVNEDFVLNNPHLDYTYVDLLNSIPPVNVLQEFQFNDSQEAWDALYSQEPFAVLDNEDSLSST